MGWGGGGGEKYNVIPKNISYTQIRFAQRE